MKFSDCKKKCQHKRISSKEPAIELILKIIEMRTGKKIKTCEEFCQVYTTFLNVGELFFGMLWKLSWRKTINQNQMKIFKCEHCGEIYETRTSTEHIIDYILKNKLWVTQ